MSRCAESLKTCINSKVDPSSTIAAVGISCYHTYTAQSAVVASPLVSVFMKDHRRVNIERRVLHKGLIRIQLGCVPPAAFRDERTGDHQSRSSHDRYARPTQTTTTDISPGTGSGVHLPAWPSAQLATHSETHRRRAWMQRPIDLSALRAPAWLGSDTSACRVGCKAPPHTPPTSHSIPACTSAPLMSQPPVHV
jgi:hypothetical protein